MDNTILIRARLFALLLLFLINPYNINSASTAPQSSSPVLSSSSSSSSSAAASSSSASLKLGILCKLSEFQCKTQTSIVSNRSTCIPLIKYCDGVYDCHDKSDEPQLCSICNRTYFGETGKTYELEIQQPKEFPFLCHLNFTAGGGNYGDLIQINFDKFNVGRFQPSFGGSGGGSSSSSSSTSSSSSSSSSSASASSSASSSSSTSSHHGHESPRNRDRCLDGYMKIRERKNSIQNTLSSTSSSVSSSSTTLSKYFNFNTNNNNNNNILNSNSNNNNNNINYDDGGSGEWCGSAWGYTVYYSETHSINITIKLEKFLQQNSPENNFEFKLSFKFLKRNEAKLRYDGGIWTGEHVTGTYCDKNLYDCDKRICRIRSPNFPGIYPRNLTCKYLIQYRQPPPAGLHAMIVVRQPDGHKIHIKEQGPNFEQNNRALKSWDQCERGQDFLSIKDGKTIDSPELARICGGDSVPDIISSGPNMMIEFKTAAVDSLFHPNPISYLLGFELQVHIMYVNSNSQAYVRQPGQCEFILSAYESPSGELTPPQHTLPPNTMCRYQFQGRRHEIVWISFIKYHSTLDSAIFQPSECSAQLRIWDGRLMLPSSSSSSNFSRTDGSFGGNNNGGNDLYRQHQYYRNASLMDEICGEETPKLCSRSLIAKGTRPCSSQESYLSTGPEMTIEFKPSPSGNAKAYGPNASFKLKYEFVDTSLGGAPMDAASTLYQTKPSSMPEPAALVTQTQFKSCDRVYRSFSSKRGIFRSPSNVFMFGRGGAPNISCTIRFEASMGESVRLTITRARFGGRACQNIQNRSGRWHCNNLGGPRSDLRIGELPWPDISPLPRDCLCSDISGSLTLAPLAASVVEVQFTTLLMDVDQDFRDFYFEGRYEFAMDGCETLWNERRLKGRSGEAYLKPTSCSPLIQPWLLEPDTDGGYLVLKLKGFWMPTMLQSAPPCPTDARITVYPTNNPKNAKDLCPSGPEVVAFSDGWEHANEFNPIETAKGLIIEYRSPWKPGVEIFDYKFSWMEVFPGTECPYQCPELQACIPSELWCDGISHCPSGYDESATQCEIRLPLSPLHVGLGAATLTILLSLAAGLAACFRRKRVEKKQIHQNHHHHLEANGRHHHPHYHLPPPPPTSTLPHHHNLPPIYLDSSSAKDSFC